MVSVWCADFFGRSTSKGMTSSSIPALMHIYVYYCRLGST
eukprot:SAG25_NODE_11615_length_300_cov_0.726368_1_plen_39_part_01